MKNPTKLCLAMAVLCAMLTPARAEVALSVDTQKVLHRIDEKVYGHFLEHIYHSINGGLWGDLVWNRTFEDGPANEWEIDTDILRQRGNGAGRLMFLTSGDMADFEFTFEAKKTGGDEGFLIPIRYVNDKEFLWVNLGGWENKKHAIERRVAGEGRQRTVSDVVDGTIETGRWYKISVRCEGPRITVKLDGETILDYTDDANRMTGAVGVGTWQTQAEFTYFSLSRLNGEYMPVKLEIPLPRDWTAFGDGLIFPRNDDDALNGRTYITIDSKDNPSGIRQANFCLKAGETYEGSLWAAGTMMQLAVSVPGVCNDAIPSRDYSKMRGESRDHIYWKEFPLRFTATEDVPNATLEIGVKGLGVVHIDQVSLMPKSWKDNYDGMRPDLLNAIKDIRPPVIRWPGGCYASAYRWKDGVGPQHQRGSHPQSIWGDRDVNSFGTDEFIRMCRRVGAEPVIVVNIGTPHWNRGVENDWLQEALDWIEYCNGSVDTKWGAVRAANGHPEPYNVIYWEIDNETQGCISIEEYVEAVKRFAPAMRAKSPGIKLAASGAHFPQWDERVAWDKTLIDGAAEHFDYLSIHRYNEADEFATGIDENERFFELHRQWIADSKNPAMKLYDSEWNAMSTDWRTGLYCGGLLNAMERCDMMEMAGPALFLRHTSARGWDNAFVNFDNATWFPAPNYVVMKLFRDHYAPLLLSLTGETDGVNITATKTEDGKRVTLKAVNPTDTPKTLCVKLCGFKGERAAMQIITADGLRDRNTLAAPDKIAPKDAPVEYRDGEVRFTLPALSVGVVDVE